ncbi:MAG: PH domain-containing protein, partial [Clostridia bacterium]|nr:PH domain-containing protein [Clostridia bacterium]
FVLLIPLLRAAVQLWHHRPTTSSFLWEAVLLAVLLLVAALYRRSMVVEWQNDRLILRRGVVFRRVAVLPIKNLAALTVTRTPIGRIFGVSSVSFHTEAGILRRSDLIYLLRGNDVKKITERLYGSVFSPFEGVSARRFLLWTASDSSAITGWAVAVPIIRRAGKLFGIALSRLLLIRISDAATRFDAYFPAVLNGLTLLLIFGYAVSFLSSLITLGRFRLSVGRVTVMQSGLLTRRTVYLPRQNVRAVRLEQKPLLQLLSRASLRITAGAVGQGRIGHNFSFPIDREESLKSLSLRAFLPFAEDGITLRPPRNRRVAFRFYRLPIFLLAVVLTAAVILGNRLVFFNRFAVFLTLPLLVGVAYYGHLCRYNYRSGSLTFGRTVSAQNSVGAKTCKLYCSRAFTAYFRCTQTPRDRRENTCNVRVFLRAKASNGVKVRHLNADAARENLNTYYMYNSACSGDTTFNNVSRETMEGTE